MYNRTYVLVYYYYLICILTITPLVLHCYPESEPIALVPITALLGALTLYLLHVSCLLLKCQRTSCACKLNCQRFGERTFSDAFSNARIHAHTHLYQLVLTPTAKIFSSNSDSKEIERGSLQSCVRVPVL